MSTALEGRWRRVGGCAPRQPVEARRQAGARVDEPCSDEHRDQEWQPEREQDLTQLIVVHVQREFVPHAAVIDRHCAQGLVAPLRVRHKARRQ